MGPATSETHDIIGLPFMQVSMGPHHVATPDWVRDGFADVLHLTEVGPRTLSGVGLWTLSRVDLPMCDA